MLAYFLAIAVGFGSFSLYMAAFFFPEVHRKYDFIWSGIGMFYALVLWVCAGRITGGVLLGQLASISLLGWFGWQTLQLRRDLTPPDRQTLLPGSAKSLGEVLQNTLKTLQASVQRRLTRNSLPRPSNKPPVQASDRPSSSKDIIQRTRNTASKPKSKPRVDSPTASSPTPKSPTTSKPKSTKTAAKASKDMLGQAATASDVPPPEWVEPAIPVVSDEAASSPGAIASQAAFQADDDDFGFTDDELKESLPDVPAPLDRKVTQSDSPITPREPVNWFTAIQQQIQRLLGKKKTPRPIIIREPRAKKAIAAPEPAASESPTSETAAPAIAALEDISPETATSEVTTSEIAAPAIVLSEVIQPETATPEIATPEPDSLISVNEAERATIEAVEAVKETEGTNEADEVSGVEGAIASDTPHEQEPHNQQD